jgi:hypothetical protein
MHMTNKNAMESGKAAIRFTRSSLCNDNDSDVYALVPLDTRVSAANIQNLVYEFADYCRGG